MGDTSSFPAELLELWRDEREVRVETSAAPGRPMHRTIIWIVVDETGRALVRSFRGATARWYREATATGRGAILTRTERIPVSFEHAADTQRVIACSAELERKYAGDPATPAMVGDEALDTTLELRPA